MVPILGDGTCLVGSIAKSLAMQRVTVENYMDEGSREAAKLEHYRAVMDVPDDLEIPAGQDSWRTYVDMYACVLGYNKINRDKKEHVAPRLSISVYFVDPSWSEPPMMTVIKDDAVEDESGPVTEVVTARVLFSQGPPGHYDAIVPWLQEEKICLFWLRFAQGHTHFSRISVLSHPAERPKSMVAAYSI